MIWFNHQSNPTKTSLRFGRVIHLACIAQLTNDPMGIRSEFKDHSLTCEAYVSLKPKGGGFGWDFV